MDLSLIKRAISKVAPYVATGVYFAIKTRPIQKAANEDQKWEIANRIQAEIENDIEKMNAIIEKRKQ